MPNWNTIDWSKGIRLLPAEGGLRVGRFRKIKPVKIIPFLKENFLLPALNNKIFADLAAKGGLSEPLGGNPRSGFLPRSPKASGVVRSQRGNFP